jgi:streptomycin 6-kinase
MVNASFEIPAALRWIRGSEEGREWLRLLPERVTACSQRWRLETLPPFQESFVSIVFPATREDGSGVVLKIQYPHRESDHEDEALRRWNGDGAVRLIDYDGEHHALLLERCVPGVRLSTAGGDEALRVFAELLPRLWIAADEPFTRLADEAATWIADLPAQWERAGKPFELPLLDLALESLDGLRLTQGPQVLLHQDLHADNVLRAEREPWLVIDPKPLVGEREFSLAPIVRSAELGHSRAQVVRRLDTLSTQLGIDRERARLWTLGQTIAWACGSAYIAQHVETAGWISQA